jgi:RimJ/RimL family protein N-acetyltransferase
LEDASRAEKAVPAAKQAEVTLWTGDDIQKATGGEWISGCGAEIEATGVSYYFHHARRGDLFIITSPDQWGRGYSDAYRRLPQLAERGVAAAIIDRKPEHYPEGLPLQIGRAHV